MGFSVTGVSTVVTGSGAAAGGGSGDGLAGATGADPAAEDGTDGLAGTVGLAVGITAATGDCIGGGTGARLGAALAETGGVVVAAAGDSAGSAPDEVGCAKASAAGLTDFGTDSGAGTGDNGVGPEPVCFGTIGGSSGSGGAVSFGGVACGHQYSIPPASADTPTSTTSA